MLKNCFNFEDCTGKYVKLKILKWSVVGKYEIPPEAKNDNETSLFWKGINLKVVTSPNNLLRIE